MDIFISLYICLFEYLSYVKRNTPPPSGGGYRCKALGCNKLAQGRGGKCVSHGGGRKCGVAGCGKYVKADGKCKAHLLTADGAAADGTATDGTAIDGTATDGKAIVGNAIDGAA